MSIVYKNKKLFVSGVVADSKNENAESKEPGEFEKHEVANDIISANIDDNNNL